MIWPCPALFNGYQDRSIVHRRLLLRDYQAIPSGFDRPAPQPNSYSIIGRARHISGKFSDRGPRIFQMLHLFLPRVRRIHFFPTVDLSLSISGKNHRGSAPHPCRGCEYSAYFSDLNF